MRRRTVLILIMMASSVLPARARTLGLEERVAAQKAIEQVYWNHRIWPEDNALPKPPLSAVMPDAVIRDKVEDYLKKSNALETWWQHPITGEQLQAEMDRMSRDTHDGAMLEELYRALGSDPFLVAETLARQTLAERLIRDLYVKTGTALWAQRSFDSWWAAESESIGSTIVTARWPFTLSATVATGCVNDTWSPTSASGLFPRSYATVVWTGTEMIVWGGGSGVNTGARYNPATDSWTPTSTGTNVPSSRTLHTAVWTGTEMIVWGGFDEEGEGNSGGRYNPSTDSWTPTSWGANVPEGRYNHTAVWTGSEMIVWGGGTDTGGRYDPAMDTWRATSTAGVPSGRRYHTAVWTGTEMIVWGGSNANDGGRYNPSADHWLSTSTGANVPLGRQRHSAVWTGGSMIVWGGEHYDGNSNTVLGTGGRLNLFTGWTPTSTGANTPTAQAGHAAVWTGSEMIVWGNHGGGRYNPSTNSWALTAPGPLAAYTAVWTGTEMIVWGNQSYAASYCACPNGRLLYRDADGDGYGNPAISIPSCDGSITQAGYVADGTDCDDSNFAVHPHSTETCDGIDNDCSGVVDDGGDALCHDPCSAECHGSAGCVQAATPCLQVDFAPAASAVAAGFVKDDGSVFSPARGFGWSGIVPTRARGSANPRELDTFVFSQVERTWTAEVANGNYEVCLEAGDPSFAQGPQRVKANGVTLIDDVTTAANHFARSCPAGGPVHTVPVRSGRLALAIGGTSGNTLLNYLRAAPGSRTSPVLWSISFQPASSSSATGFMVDSGQLFDAARGYGWDVAVPSRERNQPVPQVLDTFVFSSAVRTWELSLPSGDYDVWYGLGDAAYAQGPQRLVLEGNSVVQDVTVAAGVFIEGKAAVHVGDGRLSVQIGGGGGAFTMLDYVVVAPTDSDGDGTPSVEDDCPLAYDPDQEDGDADGAGDACDNCPGSYNPSQADTDHDQLGDSCDLDDGLIWEWREDKTSVSWQSEQGPTSWNLYIGDLDVLRGTGEYTQFPGSNPLAYRECGRTSTFGNDSVVPDAGRVSFSLVTGVTSGIEGTLGASSAGVRPNPHPCP